MRLDRRMLLALAAVWMAAPDARSASAGQLTHGALDPSDPRRSEFVAYLCGGRTPSVAPGKAVAHCPCPEKSGAPGKEEPGPQSGFISDVYLGSFTSAHAEQALVTIYDCAGHMGDTTTLILEKKSGAWKAVAYRSPTEEELDERDMMGHRVDLDALNDGLVGDCLSWTDPEGLTRFVCQGGAALYTNVKGASTLYGVAVVYAVEVSSDASQVSDEPILRFVDNTHSDCDLMPMRHRGDVSAWSIDASGKAPRLTLRLDLGDGKTTKHGHDKACYDDVPATRHVDLAFDWTGVEWRPTAAAAREIAALRKVYDTFTR